MPQPCPVLLMARELGIGGSERQLAATAQALDRTRFTPHVGCFHADGFRARELEAAGIPVLHLPVRSFLSGSAVAGAVQMGRYLRKHAIRIVHAFDVPLDLFAVPVARWNRVPVVISSQRAHRSLTPGATRTLLRITDRMVDAVVVNCLAVRRELIEEDRVPPPLIHVCYNSIDIARFQPEPRRRQPVVENASLVIGIVCALRPEKRIDTLLEAFARLRARNSGIALVIIGGGPAAGDLADRSRALGLAGACHFIPPVADVADWLRSIDIFVLPSESEALSNSLMEAMACGCAVVASNAGGNPELVQDGETGLLFPAGHVAALARRLEELLASETLRRRLAGAGAAFIRDGFSLNRPVARFETLYAKILDSSGA